MRRSPRRKKDGRKKEREEKRRKKLEEREEKRKKKKESKKNKEKKVDNVSSTKILMPEIPEIAVISRENTLVNLPTTKTERPEILDFDELHMQKKCPLIGRAEHQAKIYFPGKVFLELEKFKGARCGTLFVHFQNCEGGNLNSPLGSNLKSEYLYFLHNAKRGVKSRGRHRNRIEKKSGTKI